MEAETKIAAKFTRRLLISEGIFTAQRRVRDQGQRLPVKSRFKNLTERKHDDALVCI